MKPEVGPRGVRRPARGEAGYALAALLVAVSVMLVMLGAAVPAWRYVVKNEREEEMLYRGGEIADAVQRHQRKRGNALPQSLEELVKLRFLRHPYKDPMTKDGKWRFIRPGEPLPGLGAPPPGGRPPQPGGGQPAPGGSPQTPGGPSGPPSTLGQGAPGALPGQSTTGPGGQAATSGPFLGVVSLSKEKGLRLFNGRENYNEWYFASGLPRIIGRTRGLGVRPGVPPGPGPGVPPRPGTPPVPGTPPGPGAPPFPKPGPP